MANPYYIAPQQGSGVMAGIDTLSRLYGLKQAGEQIKLSRAEQEQRARIHGEGQVLERDKLAVSQGTLELGQERLAHDKQKATQELPIHQQPFDQVGINKFKWLVKSQGIDKAAQPLVDDMEKIMETGATKADAMQMLTAPEYVAGLQKRLLEGLSKDHMKALEAGDSMRAKDIERFMQGVSDPEGLTKMIGSMFNQTQQSMETERLEQEKLAREAEGTPAEQWTTQTLPDGTTVRVDVNTGKMEKVTSPPSGMMLETGPDGSVRFVQGPGAGSMERRTRGDVEKKLYDVNESVARLNEIAGSYRPEFLQVLPRVQAELTRLKDKFQGTPLDKITDKVSTEERAQLQEFSAFKRDALQNINDYIKAITGAQMSEKEASRIRKAMPDPGEGIFDGDSPTEFEAKWKSVMKHLRMSQARHIYYLNQGMAPAEVEKMTRNDALLSFSAVEDKIDERGKELQSQGLSNEEIQQRLQGEFFKVMGAMR